MKLGIEGRWAIVCASSRGLGKGCAMALAQEGVNVVINGVTAATLERTADKIRSATGVAVKPVVADVSTEEGRQRLLAACPQPDILVNNAGGPPTGDFRNFTREQWLSALDTNMLAPIELIKATIDGMIDRRFGRIVNITSISVKAPIGSLGLSNGARSGLTGFAAGIARDVSRHNVTINNILPGSFGTDRLRDNANDARQEGQSVDDVLAEWKSGESSGRFGEPHELGAVCAFLCGMDAGYITRQNIFLDGGSYPGTF
ncbi:3-oxoacyl-[acyl-carrier protein] reductase [Phyllobacterium trifolii]|uniref:3-oxoacyl-[acyl-carrier protein] reductase n=1 Tax=Phyllobacterium trifolii TaxID=300193 RepID=A0A839UH74_9HYPH|nr:SDR family oxidoreductase [Phyllobacterium trifolii]MBB3149164.1 3-oxoacyl-[acyl-carrier protein] reductase [Phyllobacterium trifolii]